MERTGSGSKSLLIVIVVLVAFNVIITLIGIALAITAMSLPQKESEGGTKAALDLPSDLATNVDRARVFSEFKRGFNSGDDEQVLSLFGQAYQLQITAADWKDQMERVREIASRIDEGAYLYYEYEEFDAGLARYDLLYEARVPQGQAEIRLSFTQQGNDASQLMSFYIDRKQ